eukprot:gene13749-19653_t
MVDADERMMRTNGGNSRVMPAFTCRVCFGTESTKVNGLAICQACGTQSEELEEYGTGTSARRLLYTGGRGIFAPAPSNLVAADHSLAKQRLTYMARTYVSCLQALLKAQVEALPAALGVHPDVGSAMRHLWLSVVPLTGFLDYDTESR